MEHYEIRKNNLVLADDVKHYKNFIFKVKGLMFSKPLRKGQGILFSSREEGIIETTIHMLFVFFPIDIIWLNSKKEVVDFKKNVIPFIPWLSPCKASKYVLELPKNSIKHVQIGDQLNFKRI